MGIKERKEKERLRVRVEIVEAAERIFSTDGINKTTVDSIAALAEVSKTTLYTYFKSKDELILAVHTKGEEILTKELSNVYESGADTKTVLRGLFDAYLAFHDKFPDHANTTQYIIANNVKVDEDNQDLKRELDRTNELLVKWNKLFERGKEEGLIREAVKPTNVAIITWLQLNSLLASYSFLEETAVEFNLTRQELYNDYFKFIFYGIFTSE